jgi:hypothetical protein
MILDESTKALISYRLESAREKLSTAEDLFEKRHYKDSVSHGNLPAEQRLACRGEVSGWCGRPPIWK